MSGDGERDELLELLYGESDDATAARIAADEERAAELEGFRRVRSLFASLADEEPPAAVSAKLLAAAAERAEAASRPGLWERVRAWLAPIAHHPGLAAAASLVLVAGVAGALYVTGGDELAPTGARSEAPAPETVAAPAAAPQAEPTPPPAEVATGEAAFAEEAVEAKTPAGDSVRAEAEARPKRERRDRTTRRKSMASERGGGVVGGAIAEEQSGADALRVERKPPEPARRKPASTPTTREAPRTGSSAPRAPAPPPVAQPEAAPDEPAGAPRPEQAPVKDTDDYSGAKQERHDTAADAAALHERARAAAAAGECATVASLGRRIQKLDPRYYRDVFARDDELRACRKGD